jgi:hypothetical protein
MIKRYKKKPIVIEAIQWVGANFKEVDSFVTCEHSTFPSAGEVHIKTLEGTMVASMDDFIIKGIFGEFYPCKPDIFHETYDEYE